MRAPAGPAAATGSAPLWIDAPIVTEETMRDELAHASAERERLRDDNGRLAELRASLEQRLAAESQRSASFERALAARDVKILEIFETRDAVAAELEQVRAALLERETALADLGAKLEAASAAAAAAAPAPAADRWAAAERHLLFFQGADGYELVERAGPPPAAGDLVEVPGGARQVVRIAGSPAPGSRLPCAYLVVV